MAYTTIYTSAEVVEIVIRIGTKKERQKLQDENRGVVVIPHDPIIGDFYKFLTEEKITPYRSISSGGGGYHALFAEQDAVRVEKWLRDRKAKRSKWYL